MPRPHWCQGKEPWAAPKSWYQKRERVGTIPFKWLVWQAVRIVKFSCLLQRAHGSRIKNRQSWKGLEFSVIGYFHSCDNCFISHLKKNTDLWFGSPSPGNLILAILLSILKSAGKLLFLFPSVCTLLTQHDLYRLHCNLYFSWSM